MCESINKTPSTKRSCAFYPAIIHCTDHHYSLFLPSVFFVCLFFLCKIRFVSMESRFQNKSEENSSPQQKKKIQKRFLVLQTVLRTSGIAAALIGLGLMATNNQTSDYLSIHFQVKYSYCTSFTFFVAANAVACFFSVVSLCLLFLYCIKPSNRDQSKYFIIFLSDLIALVSVVPGIAAASTIGLLGLNGNEHAGWLPICDHFGKFCHRGIASIIISSVAALIFLFLTIWSARKSSIKLQSSPTSSNIYAD